MDNVPGPAKTIHDLQAEIERYKAQYGELPEDTEKALVYIANTIGETVAIDVTGAATPVPVSQNFAGVDISAQKDTPTDAIAVLALRIGDLEAKVAALTGLAKCSDDSLSSLVDHLFATLGFKKPDPGNG